MPCAGMTGLTEAQKVQREAQKQRALAKVEQDIMAGRVKLIAQGDGSTKIEGWSDEERVGWCDSCAIRRLTAEGSSALRMAQSRTQAVPDRMRREQIR